MMLLAQHHSGDMMRQSRTMSVRVLLRRTRGSEAPR
jgi:hypothetical protein